MLTGNPSKENIISSTTSTSLQQWNSKPAFENEPEKITNNLSSLQFEAGIEGAERHLLFLRKRSHLLTLDIVSHAVYFAAVAGEVKRRACAAVANDGKDKKMVGIKVGLIGCGRIGTHLVHALLEYGKVKAEDIKISTRRPEDLLVDFQAKGVKCVRENIKATEEVDILFFCFPPNQMLKVSKEIKGSVKCLVYSVIAGVSVKKISEMIEQNQVFKPSYLYITEQYLDDSEWTYNSGVLGSLAMNKFKIMTCPLAVNSLTSEEKEKGTNQVIQVDLSLLHCLFLHSLNICRMYNGILSREESVELCNQIIFYDMIGFSFDSIKQMDSLLDEEGYFVLNEFKADTKDRMPLENDSVEFRQNFVNNYKMLFDRFVHWKLL